MGIKFSPEVKIRTRCICGMRKILPATPSWRDYMHVNCFHASFLNGFFGLCYLVYSLSGLPISYFSHNYYSVYQRTSNGSIASDKIYSRHWPWSFILLFVRTDPKTSLSTSQSFTSKRDLHDEAHPVPRACCSDRSSI